MKQKEELAKSFKCRASAAGKLATNPRAKTEVLSETTKTFAKEWLIEQIYGYRKEIKSKYLDKGNQLEDVGIDKAIEWLDLKFVLKNEKHFEDEFFTGTPDLILEDEIIELGSFEGYRPLVVKIVEFFISGKSPVPTRETLEIYAFMTAANISNLKGGNRVSVKSLLNDFDIEK